MEKYAVVVDEEMQKSAGVTGARCPSCGGTNVDYKTSTPHCPNCGTEPWEPHDRKKKTKR